MSGGPKAPIFYDPEERRWPLARGLLFLAGLVAAWCAVLLLLAVLINPVLPALGLPAALAAPRGLRPEALPPPPAPMPAPAIMPRTFRGLEERRWKRLQEYAGRRGAKWNARRPQASKPKPVRAAYFVNWDAGSLTSLKQNHERLDFLFPEWFHLTGAKAELRPDNPTYQQEVLSVLRPHAAELRWLPLVNNFNGREWEGEALARNLAIPSARARIVRELVEAVRRVEGSGACVDVEDIPFRSYPDYLLFLQELGFALHAEKMLLAVNAPMARQAYPYRRIAWLADFVVLVAYDQHWAAGEPGPLAAQSWYAGGIERCAAEVPPEKLLVAVGNYASDWVEKEPATPRTFEETVLIAKVAKAEWQWDAKSLNPFFAYADGKGRTHQVWVLDAATAFNQLAAGRSSNPAPRGFALWRLGSEDPTLWRVWDENVPLDSETAQGLAEVPFNRQVQSLGQGETIRVTAVPTTGRREIICGSDGKRILDVRFTAYPSPYVVTRYGAAEKKIVLTFDDGPDPECTPAILATLKGLTVPAVFFIVGLQGERYPALLQQMVAEGHEVANHTFTHPNLTRISLRELEVELAATQRVLESWTGRQTLLFRPPYGEDTEPRTTEELEAVEAVNQLGYLSIGMGIDPHDWSGPPEDQIVRRVIEQAERGDGNILLLHDSGGDRSQTVRALPRIVSELRGRGFQFVSLAELLGLTRDDLMPPLSARALAGAWLNNAGFWLVNVLWRALSALFFLGIVLGLARLAFIGVLAVIEARRKGRMAFRDDYLPPVAVIVPAYNEEKVVVQTVRSLLVSDYGGPMEIVVVDDGSKDATLSRAREAFGGEPRVRIFTKPNGGKSAALNFGIARTQAEIVVAMDADTIFRPDTVSKLVRHFAAPEVGAVAGNAKVGNRINLLTRWQALEYITCQNLDRRAFSYLNCITVVPGAVGAWRKALVEQAGGFTHQTLAEDADLTLAIRRLGHRVFNEDEAVALTEAPDTVRGFLKQRFRWMFGTLQAAVRHGGALFRPRYGALGFVALPNIFIFQVFFPLISPVADAMLVFSLASGAVEAWRHAGQPPAASGHVLAYYLLFVGADYLAGFLAFALEPKEDRKLLLWLFLQRFFYRQLMYYVAIQSTLAALRGAAVGWGKLERKATVPSAG